MGEDKDHRVVDHTLINSDVRPNDEPPQVYAVSDLRAFVKPVLDEELSGPDAGLSASGVREQAAYGRTICNCVPIEVCVCNMVVYHAGGHFYPGYDTCPVTVPACTSTDSGGPGGGGFPGCDPVRVCSCMAVPVPICVW